eukprot:1160105-Pelagomonas_calceolata.AAC.6
MEVGTGYQSQGKQRSLEQVALSLSSSEGMEVRARGIEREWARAGKQSCDRVAIAAALSIRWL